MDKPQPETKLSRIYTFTTSAASAAACYVAPKIVSLVGRPAQFTVAAGIANALISDYDPRVSQEDALKKQEAFLKAAQEFKAKK